MKKWHLWMLGMGLGVAGWLCTLALVMALHRPTPPPALYVTLHRTPYRSPTPSASPTLTPSPEVTLVRLYAGGYALGFLVQIEGTGDAGLRLREHPSLQAPVRFIARELEVFRIVDGPVDQDGYRWWRLQSLQAPERQGWAVQSFLRLLPTPTPSPSPPSTQ